MADQIQNAADAVKDAVQNVTEKVGELTTESNTAESNTTTPQSVLDEVTGEHVSKTEYKKRVKQRAVEAKKAEKAANAPAPAQKKKSAEEEEAHLNPNQYFEIRSRAIQKLRQSHQPNPYVIFTRFATIYSHSQVPPQVSRQL